MNQKHASGSQVGEGEGREVDGTTSRTDAGHPTASSEVLRLAEELNRIPETRQRLVTRAVERYESGYYLTQEAAELTADRLSGKFN